VTPAETFALAPDVVLQMIDREALVLKLHEEVVFSLNDTGARIAQLAAEGLAIPELTTQLCEEFGVDASHLEVDVRELIDLLLARGILVSRREADA